MIVQINSGEAICVWADSVAIGDGVRASKELSILPAW